MKMAPDMLTPLTDHEWPEHIDHLLRDFGGKLNVYRVMAHHPALLAAWEKLRNHIVLQSALTPRQREIVILRVGHRWGSAYEWAHHHSRGLDAGLTCQEIESIRQAALSHTLSNGEFSLVRAVDELLDNGQLTADTLGELQKMVGKEGVLDVMATAGMYTTLAFILKTFNTPLEPEFLPPEVDAKTCK